MEPIPFSAFKQRLRGNCELPSIGQPSLVVGLRDLAKIECIIAMPVPYLNTLMYSVTLVGDSTIRPYAGKKISIRRMDPRGMRVSQTFVERKKLLGFLERFGNTFENHHITGGVAKLMPFIAYGETKERETAIAHYLPPILELRDGRVLLDGTHRNLLAMQTGTTIEAVHIYHVETPLPCEPVGWEEVKPVDEKPEKEYRFRSLNRHFFRNLDAIGVDG
ncbi:MAG: hypothetical protein AAGA35_00615 [Patescibacteria group bacterium]